jgi:EAL domain-containing protein (putative c-di-GMP-specific phosphodiesterase class I)
VELELAVMTRTLERVEEDGVQVVSCALSLEALRDPAFQAIVAALPPSRMLLRFDVDEPIDDYEELTALLRPLRRLGARVAIDRVGDGAAELRHILLLSPDVLRIDPVLVRGLHADPARRVLVESLLRRRSARLAVTGQDVGCSRLMGGSPPSEVCRR